MTTDRAGRRVAIALDRGVFKLPEAATYLNLNQGAVRELARSGELDYWLLGGGEWRITRRSVDAYIERRVAEYAARHGDAAADQAERDGGIAYVRRRNGAERGEQVRVYGLPGGEACGE